MTSLDYSLADLLSAAPLTLANLKIGALAYDSRKVVPGALFFSIAGAKGDGLDYAHAAVEKGAVAIVADRAPHAPFSIPTLCVPDARAALAEAAARFYPRQPPIIAAVTGTSGKTSVTAFLRQIWRACGHQAASLGTIGLIAPSGAVYGSLTTPDPITLHETLDRLTGEGATHLAMEASSHGLDQHRLDGVRLKAAAFTNLSRDHLDYHATLEDYLAAKLRLFDTLMTPGLPAVINMDDAAGAQAALAARKRDLTIFTFGRAGKNLRLVKRRAEGLSTRATLDFEGASYRILLPLAGEFQTYNALTAAALAIVCGEKPERVFAALETLEGAPGRLELAAESRGAAAFVDYAHKPAALESAIIALRPFTKNRLIVVFGCGGDRDKGKRPLMGEIAARLADIAIVTDDNPRSENPAAIRAEILAGARNATMSVIAEQQSADVREIDVREIGDRACAIAAAAAMAQTGDIVLVAGKGHETGQIIGARTLPFSDLDVVRAAFAREAA